MKKSISCLLIIAMILTFASCAMGGEEPPVKPGESGASTSTSPAGKDVSVEVVANALASCEAARELGMGGEPLVVAECATSGKLFGMTEEISGYSACYSFSPPIFPSGLLGLVFELKDSTDIDAFKADAVSKADKAYNVCMGVDSALCESAGRFVLLIMLNGGEKAAEPYVTAFHEAVGE